MAIFNHVVQYSEDWDDELNENRVLIQVDYDDVFGKRRTACMAFQDPRHKKFDVSRVRISGRAITGSVLRPALVLDTPPGNMVKVAHKEGNQLLRWIDDELPMIGLQVYLVESFHPETGALELLVTAQKCQTPGMMSMNIMVLDESLDAENPVATEYVNVFTGEGF